MFSTSELEQRPSPYPCRAALRRKKTRSAACKAFPKSFFLVPPNDFPETFPGRQTCCSVVVGVRDVRIGMVQKRAGEVGVLTAARGDGGGDRGAKQMRAHLDTYGREGG